MKRIFGLINKNSGPGFHRIMVPLALMPDVDVYITNAVEEKDFDEKGCSAIYYNRIISDDVLKLQSKYHFKVVVDVDDWWELDPHHIMFKYSKLNSIPAHQKKHLRIADVVTCTHERLAERVYEFNKNVVVLPNAIPNDKDWFPVIKTTAALNTHGVSYRRVFWQGSVTHEADLKQMNPIIKRLDRDKFLMVIAGATQQVEWERMIDGFTNRMKMRGVLLPGLPPTQYYTNYQFADVAVVPLLSTKFNQYKSNLKVLEAAHSGVPVIASNVHPYKGMPILYVNKREDWYTWLNDFAAQEECGRALYRWAQDNFNFEKINEQRRKVFDGSF